jgi:hypothetical protein
MEIEYPSVSTTYILPYDSDFLGTLLIRNFFSLMIFFFFFYGFRFRSECHNSFYHFCTWNHSTECWTKAEGRF